MANDNFNTSERGESVVASKKHKIKRNHSRDRVCVDCGKQEVVRGDNKSVRCLSCSAKINGLKVGVLRREQVVKRYCASCGNLLSNQKKFCSVKCLSEQTQVLNKVCETCGIEFVVRKSLIDKTNAVGRFCSKACYAEFQTTLVGEKSNQYNSVNVDCDFCGKQFNVTPYRLNEYINHYCSEDCKHQARIGMFAGEDNPNWRGGHIKRKGNFLTVKSRYFSGIKFCALCGTTRKIHIHHIMPYRHTQDNSLSNLIPLCGSCHRKVEIVTWYVVDECCDNQNYEEIQQVLSLFLRGLQMATYVKINSLLNKADRNAGGSNVAA